MGCQQKGVQQGATGNGSTSQKSPSSEASPSSTNASSETQTKTKVTLGLNWFPEAEHGGFYAALVHGYFTEEGLEVTIRPGGPKVPVISDVASGMIEFGVDNADKLLLLRAQQADAVAVMSPIQNSPRCIMVHKNSGLERLEDLKGKKPFTLAMNAGQPFAQFLKKRVDLTDIQIVAYPGNVVQFLSQPDYGQQAYSFSEPFVAEQKESDPVCLMLSEIGFNTYTSLLITRRELIDQQPELVAKMTRASIRGWEKYLSDPVETNQHIHTLNPEMGLEVLEFGVKALTPLCLPNDVSPVRLGQMSVERWKTLVEQMIEIGSLTDPMTKPESAFTTQFLESE
ncbi:MAG: ABC transporter substrate-binding protein [Planctomycetes bacterium]|nr:ABC transporter substrate-binding protein [Planctomycetota bacterium]